MTYLFSLRCYCFFSQGAAVWSWGPLYTKQVASYNPFKGASFMGHWNGLRESRTISKSLPSLQRLCLFTLVFTGDRRATGLQDHHPFLQNLVAPIPRVGLSCSAIAASQENHWFCMTWSICHLPVFFPLCWDTNVWGQAPYCFVLFHTILGKEEREGHLGFLPGLQSAKIILTL